MKKFAKSNFIRKTLIALCVVLVITFTLPQRVFADAWDTIGGTLLKEIVKLVASLGDIGMATLNQFMLGTDGFTSAMLSKDDANLKEGSGSWLTENLDDPDAPVKEFDSNDIDISFLGIGQGDYQVPNMLFSPENIFANNIAVFDVNFLHPNQYTSAIASSPNADLQNSADEASKSAASDLRGVISSWYISFRNIAIVGLLSVLIYLGIRIMISSTADDKARYKESIKNWVVALCLVFIIHFIMSAILMITDRVTDLFSTNINSGFIIKIDNGDINSGQLFRTNLTGLIRFQAQMDDAMQATAYTIMYMVLVVYTFRFALMYFKRFLYTAFFTMIAPLVALTYPIDKAGDGKAQAFNMWFREYTMNVIIQPVHLILYTVFVSSAMDLVSKNPLYAIVAIGFLIPAEKFIKKMFRLDQAESTSGFGSFAGGAVAMSALNSVRGAIGKGRGGKSSGGNNDSGSDDGGKAKIFTVRRTIGNGTNPGASQSQNNSSSNTSGQINSSQSEEEARKEAALRTYNNQGSQYGQNANGEYFNPYTNDYDPNYLPWEDSANLANYQAIIGNEGQNTSPSDSGNTQETENLRNVANKGKPPIQEGGRRKLAWNVAKSLGKGTYKVAKKAVPLVGAAVGAGVGLAEGIATGQPSKAITHTLTGAGIGLGIGQTRSISYIRIWNQCY